MKLILFILSFLLCQSLLCQSKTLTFRNFGKPASFGRDTFYSSSIHEIILNQDSTFEFWSRPHISCFTWKQYNGTWKQQADTICFYSDYNVDESIVKTTYKTDSAQFFKIGFSTDKNSELKNRELRVQYVYDYNARLDDMEKNLSLSPTNIIELPFKEIPNFNKLTAIRIEYQLNFKDKRYTYLTENKTVNIKQANIPNIINVEFIENPKKETVYRIIKAIHKNNTLSIISIFKSMINLPDHYNNIEFEDSYQAYK